MPLCSSCGENAFIPRVSVDLPALRNRMRTEYGPASVQPDEVATILRNTERLQQYALQVQSLLSPVRRVPDEILQCIFYDSCDMNEFIVVDANLRVPVAASKALRSKPAMVLSAVCSRWRRNALAMPAIWSRISLQWKIPTRSPLAYDKDNNAEFLFPLYNFVDRSQQSPMTVRLSVDSPGSGILLKQFLGQVAHWKHFSFHSNNQYFDELLDFPSVSFPVLNSLYVLSVGITNRELAPFIGASPNLKLLSVQACVYRDFPCSQLSHLTLDLFEQSDILCLFDRHPNLVSLDLTGSLFSNMPRTVPNVGSSSKLETLTVRQCEDMEPDAD
ncbi:hypothetical protein BDP27DRAFT_1420945 [Rhodocollybia butyracea]|uniref:F-box domain-containing protein n=1 Tax=Rhodocollybia butyracea TaxID=206335 RepID=A0A9P5PWS6_9AGAR|nr:hypothetical protein BDP27DRAFT_1420945 [Rhodocollybia butyracea]